MDISPIGVQATLRSDARAALTGHEHETATIHPAGLGYGLSLHWSTLDDAISWWHDLGDKLVEEQLRRHDAELALAEMDEALRKAGAR